MSFECIKKHPFILKNVENSCFKHQYGNFFLKKSIADLDFFCKKAFSWKKSISDLDLFCKEAEYENRI